MVLPAIEMLPKYRSIAQDLNERSTIITYSKKTVKIAINHMAKKRPGQVTMSEFQLFLNKNKDIVARHVLGTDSAINELFNSVQRSFIGTFDADDLWSVIQIRKRVLLKGIKI